MSTDVDTQTTSTVATEKKILSQTQIREDVHGNDEKNETRIYIFFPFVDIELISLILNGV